MKTFKAWITKYALTSGVQVVMGEVHPQFDNVFELARGSARMRATYYLPDWHRTRESAVRRVEEMRVAAIKAAQRKLDKLMAMRVEVPE